MEGERCVRAPRRHTTDTPPEWIDSVYVTLFDKHSDAFLSISSASVDYLSCLEVRRGDL